MPPTAQTVTAAAATAPALATPDALLVGTPLSSSWHRERQPATRGSQGASRRTSTSSRSTNSSSASSSRSWARLRAAALAATQAAEAQHLLYQRTCLLELGSWLVVSLACASSMHAQAQAWPPGLTSGLTVSGGAAAEALQHLLLLLGASCVTCACAVALVLAPLAVRQRAAAAAAATGALADPGGAAPEQEAAEWWQHVGLLRAAGAASLAAVAFSRLGKAALLLAAVSGPGAPPPGVHVALCASLLLTGGGLVLAGSARPSSIAVVARRALAKVRRSRCTSQRACWGHKHVASSLLGRPCS